MKKLLSIFIILSVIGISTSASACGFLEKSEPKVGETLLQSPKTVTVWLSVPLNPTGSFIEVKNEKGELVSIATVIPQGTDKAISAQLKPLAPGKYKVKWQMTAANCGHVSTGTFPFVVQ